MTARVVIIRIHIDVVHEKCLQCCGSEERVKSHHPALFSHALFISRVVTQWAHSSAHTSPRVSVVIGSLLLLLLLLAAGATGALHKRCSLSLRSTLLETATEEGGTRLYVLFRTKQAKSQHCTVLEHVVLSEFSLPRQINAQHRHQRNKTREKQGSFCERKQKRIGHTAHGVSQCIPSVP